MPKPTEYMYTEPVSLYPDIGRSGAYHDTGPIPPGAIIKAVELKVKKTFVAGSRLLVGTSTDEDALLPAGVLDLTGPRNKTQNVSMSVTWNGGSVRFTLYDTTGLEGQATVQVAYKLP